MATRAIRASKLRTTAHRESFDAIQWLAWNHEPETIQQPLAEAVRLNIIHAGDDASAIATQVNEMRNHKHYIQNYYQVMNNIYSELAPYLLKVELQHSQMDAHLLEKLIEMRDYVVANPQSVPDQHYVDLHTSLSATMSQLAHKVNAKYFSRPNGHGHHPVINWNLRVGAIYANYTDAQLKDWVELGKGNWGVVWNAQTHSLLRGGHGRGVSPSPYPHIPDDVMEGFMEYLTEKNPILVLKIAEHHQFFLDNPVAKSIGHSWTSRNRSGDCWFSVDMSQVTKLHTTVFQPPQELFGQHTPVFKDMVDYIQGFKADIISFLENSRPQVTMIQDKETALHEKTDEAANIAMVKVVQGLLDDPATVDVGTAIVGHIAGICHLPIDTTTFPSGYVQYTYYDYSQQQDVTNYLYPQYMTNAVALSDFDLTDAVQAVLWEAYQKNLQSLRDNHAHRCAQLARQIAQATTRHDGEMKVLTEAFAAYQTQV